MVSTAASDQIDNEESVMDMVKYSPNKDPVTSVPLAMSVEIKELIKADNTSDPGKDIEPEKQELSEDADLTSEEMDSDKGSLSPNMTILKEVKVVEQIVERKIKRKFYWYGNHKLIKPIKEIPPRFQLMLAETNAEKARCEGRPIILKQDSNTNPSIEATRGSTSFNPEAQCFVPHQPYKAKICSNECVVYQEGKDSAAPNVNGEMMTPVTGPNVPYNVPPMYTIHIYSNSTNPTSSAGGLTPVTNPCCMHVPNSSNPVYVSGNTAPPHPPIQGPPVYYTSQPYAAQQTYQTPQYPPGYLTAPGAPATVPQSIQYAPCFTYAQNTQFSTAPLMQ